MKNLAAAILLIVLAGGGLFVYFSAQVGTDAEIPGTPQNASVQGDSGPRANDSPADSNAQEPPQPGTIGSLDLLLSQLYARSDIDSLVAGALITQQLALLGEEALLSTYPTEDFFTLALSLDPRDPVLLFTVSDYCISRPDPISRFCQQNTFSKNFSDVSGDNGIAWALEAIQPYQRGDFDLAADLLTRAGDALMYTDYWPHVVQILLAAFQDSEYADSLLMAYRSAFDTAPQSFRFYRDLLDMCRTSPIPDQQSWFTACQRLGQLMQQTSSLATTALGLTIEAETTQLLGNDVSHLVAKQSDLDRLAGQLNQAMDAFASDAEALASYLAASEKLGEKSALHGLAIQGTE